MPEPVNARRRQEGPRRVKNGIRLRRRDDDLPAWPASAWRDALLAGIAPEARATGLEYARAGQLTTFAILPPERPGAVPAEDGQPQARVEAHVQGRAARPYLVTIDVAAWTAPQWVVLIEAMAREAIHAAKLLAGEFVPAVDELGASLGTPFLPRRDERARLECTCADAKPCKHLAAVIEVLGERLAETPRLVFNLRGLAHETALARLQEARALHTHGRSTAHGGAAAKVQVRPFEATLADFWRPGAQLAEAVRATRPDHVPHALLRRLGPSPLQGKFPLVGLLASIYDSVREDARRREEAGGNGEQATPGRDEAPPES